MTWDSGCGTDSVFDGDGNTCGGSSSGPMKLIALALHCAFVDSILTLFVSPFPVLSFTLGQIVPQLRENRNTRHPSSTHSLSRRTARLISTWLAPCSEWGRGKHDLVFYCMIFLAFFLKGVRNFARGDLYDIFWPVWCVCLSLPPRFVRFHIKYQYNLIPSSHSHSCSLSLSLSLVGSVRTCCC